ncbi:MAG TPA: LarC family nickel insertion protein, partial [bacterium]|nr:LarC family nickel insertion protein [bacterium]
MNLYLDCFSGIAGDMYLAALLDLGLDISELRKFLEPFEIPQLELKSSRVLKKGIEATYLHVHVGGADSEHGHHHHHDHHGHTFNDIVAFLRRQSIAPKLIQRTERVFRFIADAESKVHGKPLDELHFHEVGQWDAIVDVVGVLWGLERLGVKEVYASAVNVGGGFVQFSHGCYPVPAPATANILQSAAIPFFTTPDVGEMLTPTGAALLAETVTAFTSPGTMKVQKVAYGAGSRDIGNIPNVVRAMALESTDTQADRVVVIETNLDDMNPEFC